VDWAPFRECRMPEATPRWAHGLDPRRVGSDSWEARCPAHRSADHALAITRDQFNHLALECRSTHNCQHIRIVRALGMTNDQVYAETPDLLIKRLGRFPIQPASFASSTANGNNEAGASVTEAANESAGTLLPPEGGASADAVAASDVGQREAMLVEPTAVGLCDGVATGDCGVAAVPPVREGAEGALVLPDNGAESAVDTTSEGAPALSPDAPPESCPPDEMSAKPVNDGAAGVLAASSTPGGATIVSADGSEVFSSWQALVPFQESLPEGATSPFEQILGNALEFLASRRSSSTESGPNPERPSAVQALTRLTSTARLFRSADGRYCAQVPVGDRLEIYSLRSAGFREWLSISPRSPAGFPTACASSRLAAASPAARSTRTTNGA
jgi:hypothetical protein